MPKVNLTFQGYVSGADIDEAMTPEGDTVDVQDWTSSKLVSELEAGRIVLSLSDAMSNCNTSSCELFDYEVPFSF